jgi:hypothetical protein
MVRKCSICPLPLSYGLFSKKVHGKEDLAEYCVIMKSSLRAYLNALASFSESAMTTPQKYLTRPGKDFTKARILSLKRMTCLTLGLLKKSLNVELAQFFSLLDTDERIPTKSAFCQARDKIKPKYYMDLFEASATHFYENFKGKRWKGMRLWAADGTGMKLPEYEALGDAFGRQSNRYKAVPSSKILFYFDLLNEVVASAQLHKSTVSESTTAIRSISKVPKDVCVIYDRGFAGQTVLFVHQYYGSNCIIRLPVGFSNTVKAFVASGKNEAIITEKLSSKSKATLNAHGFEVNSQNTITYRLIRVKLPTGEIEVLLTSLIDTKKFCYAYFQELYRKRWGVETFIFVIKSFFQLFNFSTIKENGIWQDVFATFILYNLQTVLNQADSRKIKQVNRGREHDYKPNRNVTAGLLKHVIVKIMLCSQRKQAAELKRYNKLVLQTMEPVRPDRKNERRKRRLRGTERHVHEKNYRPTI